MTVAGTKQKDELLRHGFLLCSACGGQLTGCASRGKYQHYFYYHCQPGCKDRFSTGDANEKPVAEFREIPAKKEALKCYLTILEKELKKSSKENAGDAQNILTEINKNIECIDNT